ncbi:alpha/beta hydrolase [Allomuricauda sp. NBRC 101325]|uniref:alpha/beta hydrolase n=1 Tax=Allomuricauda sp. NBRC 101325 TaxID=1113758 RepID=UPI0024A332D0|nr:alpha/beta hydrolase-fold protein [Muricauda sp. NBRC 101325]GLU45200.1 esterase [Muricauda sp. NBRC 101325]
MRKIYVLSVVVFLTVNLAISQIPSGKIIVETLYSELLENPGGENPTRSVTIYLPPGYEESETNYPTLYYLPGFTDSDSLYISSYKMDQLLDKAIALHKIRPVVVVIPNHNTLYRGSMYTNSPLTGKWEEYTAIDLVNHIDNNYRTLRDKDSRGIVGHSMGGYGAIRIGMHYPEVFSSVYSLSGAFDIVKAMGINGAAYRRIGEIKTREELVSGYSEFMPNWLIVLGRAFSPNLNKPPFYADLPFNYINGNVDVNDESLELWNNNMLHNMVDDYYDNLTKLKAIKIDWGRNDDFDFVISGCRKLSQKLENMGINHFGPVNLHRIEIHIPHHRFP